MSTWIADRFVYDRRTLWIILYSFWYLAFFCAITSASTIKSPRGNWNKSGLSERGRRRSTPKTIGEDTHFYDSWKVNCYVFFWWNEKSMRVNFNVVNSCNNFEGKKVFPWTEKVKFSELENCPFVFRTFLIESFGEMWKPWYYKLANCPRAFHCHSGLNKVEFKNQLGVTKSNLSSELQEMWLISGNMWTTTATTKNSMLYRKRLAIAKAYNYS